LLLSVEKCDAEEDFGEDEQEKEIWQIQRIFLRIFVDFFKKLLIIVIRMDMIKTKPMAFEQLARAISGKKTVAGAKQLRKALVSGAAGCVYLAVDADPAITEPILDLSQRCKTQVCWVRSMTDLGRACGIEVGAAAAAAIDIS